MKILRITFVIASVLLMSALLGLNTAAASFGPGMPAHFEGQEIRMPANQSDSQMMSYVITGQGGQVIVVDGGTPADSQYLRGILAEKGNHVSAWFVTHAHSDHAGALLDILTEGLNGLTVDAVYCNFADDGWYTEKEGYRADTAIAVKRAVSASGLMHTVHRGDVINVGEIAVRVMNDPYLLDSNSINNSSVVYYMDISGNVVAFTGDLDETAADIFLTEHDGEELHVDLVQMSHHGQAGAGRNFYEALSPLVCMWNSPKWLYEDDGSCYRTAETRRWMRELGAREHYSIAYGDQIIK